MQVQSTNLTSNVFLLADVCLFSRFFDSNSCWKEHNTICSLIPSHKDIWNINLNLLSTNPTKWLNTFKQFVGVYLTILWSWRLKGQSYVNHFTFKQFPMSISSRSSRKQMFFNVSVLKNFAIFTEKHLCSSLFWIKISKH